MPFYLRSFLLALLCLPCSLRAGEGSAAEGPLYAALPLRDLSANPAGAQRIVRRLREALAGRGARFVDGAGLERALQAHRIRYTDSVSASDASSLREGTGADWLMLGTLLRYEGGGEPAIALSLRVLDSRTGRRVLSRVVALRGADFTGLLGLGAIEEADELIDEVVGRLLEDFDSAGAPLPARPEGSGNARPSGELTSFVSPDYRPQEVQRIAVLPLANRTRTLDAGTILSEVLADQWFHAAGIEVVEQAELREAMLREKVRTVDSLDLGTLARLGKVVGTRYFALGSVDAFDAQSARHGRLLPLVEAAIRVLDVESGQLVAATGSRRTGDAYHVVLGLGVEKDLIGLASRVAREMVSVVGGN